MTEQELFPTWVYPVGEGEAKIIGLAAGSEPPAGFVFSPADVTPAAREQAPAKRGKRGRK